MKGVEHVEANSYSRTLRIGRCTGYVTVRNAPEQRAILVQLTHSLTPVIPALLGKVRDTFDLSARPDLIAAQLSLDPLLAASVALRPGLRVPGAFDFFELAVRSILGQQISVAAATTLAGRYVHAFGERYETANGSLTHLTPAAERVARLRVDDIASLGVIRARAAAIIALATGIVEGRFGLHASTDAETIIERLIAVPGIGAWTAQYIAMRALRWPDAFPKEDVVVRRALGGVTAARADQLSQPWRPWRSYATLHLWQGGATPRA
jgi:AraC family transcriptional regulator of adaptative response / DNA-3-methyladenine glycosylase II